MRSRQIKPGFFKNEHLALCSPNARLLFVGLWMLADREGRLEDRPLRFKGELFPYENIDPDKLLRELATKINGAGRPEFLIRYSNKQGKFIQIVNFPKHQNPHIKEPVSTIPAPDLPGSSTVQEPDKNSSSPADSLLLTPSSLTPDILTPSIGRFTPPTLEQVQTHITNKGYHFSAEGFIGYYSSQGWKKANGRSVTDWKGCCVTFEQKEKAKGFPAPVVAAGKKEVLCLDCKYPMTKAETMESTRCRACRAESGV